VIAQEPPAVTAAEQAATSLAILAAKAGAGIATNKRLVSDLLVGVNWSRMLWAAHRLGVLPQLFKLIEAAGPSAVPQGIFGQLQAHYEKNSRRNAVLLEQWHSVTAVLQQARIPSVGLRMPSLLSRVYDDPGAREYEPADLLVRPRDFRQARNLLRSHGYRLVFDLSRSQEAAQRRARGFLPIHDDTLNVRFHLHDRVMPSFFAQRGLEKSIWASSRTTGPGSALLPAVEDLLLLLCAHGALHLWTRLDWIQDVARLLVLHPELDLHSLVERTRASRGRAKNAPYYPTPEPLVERMIAMARITEHDVVYDLGCGDGRLVITAAHKHGARGVGVDMDPERIAESKANAVLAGVDDLVTFVESDVMDVDLSEATVVLLWLFQEQHLQLRPKLERELRPGARIVGHSSDMGDWIPAQTEVVDVTFYGQESAIAYQWTVGEHTRS
jgi:hypothetical protein